MSDYTLYRFYTADGSLLYVGQTIDPSRRLREHRSQKPWWESVGAIELERYETPHHLDRAERNAIVAEAPLHNVTHAQESVEEVRRVAGAAGYWRGYHAYRAAWLAASPEALLSVLTAVVHDGGNMEHVESRLLAAVQGNVVALTEPAVACA